MTALRVGDFVRFRDPVHARYWFIDPEAVGEVVEVRGNFVVAKFGEKYPTGTAFVLVTRRAP